MNIRLATVTLLTLILAATATAADKPSTTVKVTDLRVIGRIDGQNITFTLDCNVGTRTKGQRLALVTGDVVLDKVTAPKGGYQLHYNATEHTYSMSWPGKSRGKQHVTMSFAVRPQVMQDSQWRQASFTIPASRFRQIEIVCDRTDLQIVFPGAMRVERKIVDDQLHITAIQGRDRQFTVRWKPQVQELDAKLVLGSEANTIVTAGAGVLRLDSLFSFDISQGKLTEIEFEVPASLSITQVRGQHIRNWRIVERDDSAVLQVEFNRPQTERYHLQILAEAPLAKFPTQVDLPVITPAGGIRAAGQLAVGTDSAIALVVNKTAGLAQIDASAFKRIILNREQPRTLPRGKAFYYSYAGGQYQMKLALDDIVPAYDASHRLIIRVSDDNLIIDADVELDVRDAPLRSVLMTIPHGYFVVDVKGNLIDDHSVREAKQADESPIVEIHFAKPVLGRTLLQLRLELGHSPLDTEQHIADFAVRGANNERGYLVVVPDEGITIDEPKHEGMRRVHTGSVPVRVADAEYALRFREKDWSMQLRASRRAAEVRAELFHLISLADGIAYGGVAANYFITGSPVDQLHFVVHEALQNVEFVGGDVLQSVRDKDDPTRYTVKLARKVTGDYNLAMTYTQPYKSGEQIVVGAVECDRVQTQVGFITVASHLNLQVGAQLPADTSLLEIAREEVPANYRLLVNAPILKTYKYVKTPHEVSIAINPYDRGKLLSAVIEVMDIETDIAIQETGVPESRTNIRYMIKNATEQFLSLKMPQGANVWTTRVIENFGDRARERVVTVTASHDKVNGLLLVPLKRNRDPNQPLAIEIEYGQVHDAPGWRSHVKFEAPTTANINSAFDHWKVRVPEKWSIHPTPQSTMIPESRAHTKGNLAAVMTGLGQCWRGAITHWSGRVESLYAGGFALVVCLALVLLCRRVLPDVIVACVLAAVIWLGIQAANSPTFTDQLTKPDKLTVLNFTQQVNLDAKTPLRIEADIVPNWLQHATIMGSIVAPIVALVCLVAAVFVRRLRLILSAMAVAGSCYAAAQLHPTSVALAHMLTWGLPVLLGLWFLWRVVMRPLARHGTVMGHAPVAATSLVLILLAVMPVSAASASVIDAGKLAAPSQPVMERVEVELTVDSDSVQVDMDLRISVTAPQTYDLIDQTAVLMSTDTPGANLRILERNGRYALRVTRKGTYSAKLRFLLPLADADQQQRRTIRLPLPAALTNRVRLDVTETGLNVQAPTAIRFSTREAGNATIAEAIFGPRDHAVITWKPRTRQRKLEKTVFYCQNTSVATLQPGLVETRHRLHFKIAQGELRTAHIDIPANLTVTAVQGQSLGAWRFDPSTHDLEVRLTQPVSGEYDLLVVTQSSHDKLPYSVELRPLRIRQAATQHSTLGITHTDSVRMEIRSYPQQINADDFVRDAAVLLNTTDGQAPSVRHAYRMQRDEDKVVVQVFEVHPELRAIEQVGFTVADDRLVYNGQLTVVTAKAGVFSVQLKFPKQFDVDTLTHEQVSHWDERIDGDLRIVEVHFKQKILGSVSLRLALSMPVGELPAQLNVPRVELIGALKHTGQIIITSDRGVSLSVAEKYAITELDPLELGIRQKAVLAFKLLRPDWKLRLSTNVIQPRITVDFLHMGRVSEGMVKHTHYLRYQLENAGSKAFDIEVPTDALGVVINGANIASTKQVDPQTGLWRIELASKWFDQPYLLKVEYETRYDLDKGAVTLHPVTPRNTHLHRGHVLIRASDRVKLSESSIGPNLRSAESRSVPPDFPAPDVSDAVFCYRSGSGQYQIGLSAKRHESFSLPQANAHKTVIESVMTVDGQTLTRTQMWLSVSGKRHLETRLPPGSEIWSLLVNGRPTVPSKRKDNNGGDIHLLPLAQVTSGELQVHVDFIYVAPAPKRASRKQYQGPKFDLPLKNIFWVMYLPPGYEYDDFKGTLTVNEEYVKNTQIQSYDLRSYEVKIQTTMTNNTIQAKQLLERGNQAAVAGRQRDARQALESAWHISMNDKALNEDARVQLNQLVEQQALVGLLGSRSRLRRQVGDKSAGPGQSAGIAISENLRQDEVDRLTNALNKEDSANLGRISNRIVNLQQRAAAISPQLVVNVPVRGRMLEFRRPIQVKPNADMFVSFTADPIMPTHAQHSYYYLAGVFFVVLAVFAVTGQVERHWQRLRTMLAQRREAPDVEEPMPAVETT